MCIVCLYSLSAYLFGVQTADVPDAADAEGVDDELNRADRVRTLTRCIYIYKALRGSRPPPSTVLLRNVELVQNIIFILL